MAVAQNLKNHTKLEPMYHFVLLPLNAFLVIYGIVRLFQFRDEYHVVRLLMALSLFLLTIVVRPYALKVQDRVIRLEENVRLHNLGVDPSGLSLRQMIALRFAPDAEVVELARKAATERMSPKQIKEAIVQWRADHDRV